MKMWRLFAFQKIRTQMFFSYFVIIVLCIALIGAISYYYSSKSLREIAENANSQIVSQIQQSLDQDFQSKRDVLLPPFYDSEYINGINRYESMNSNEQYLFAQKLGNLYLQSFYVAPRPDFVRFSIYYRDGELLYTSDERSEAPRHVNDQEWFRRTISTRNGAYFSPSYADAESHNRLFSASMVIQDFAAYDQFVVIRAEYNFKLLDSLSEKSNISENSQIIILDRSNRLVYSSAKPDDANLYTNISKQINEDSGSFWLRTDDGDNLQVSYLASQKSDWMLMLITPQSDILGASEMIKKVTLVIVAFALFITSLTSFWFARTITKPVLQLHQHVNRIRIGDLESRTTIHSKNEIGRIAYTFNSMTDDLQKLIKTKYVYQIQLREAELAMLYSQINPHFLYNTLGSIRAMADYHNVSDIAEMSTALADMFRYNTKKDDEWVTVRDEIGQIKDYMTIQQIRFADKIRFEMVVDDDLYEAKLLKMTLQPLAENAVYHGLERKKGKGTLTVKAANDGKMLSLKILDDGLGMTRRQLEQIRAKLHSQNQTEERSPRTNTGGIGLSNVYSRYAILYGDEFEFYIDSLEGLGTSIEIRIPISQGRSENST